MNNFIDYCDNFDMSRFNINKKEIDYIITLKY